MKKFRLSLDSLMVTSFSTAAPEPRERGTVQGNYLDTEQVCDSTRAPTDCACSRYCPHGGRPRLRPHLPLSGDPASSFPRDGRGKGTSRPGAGTNESAARVSS